MPAPENSQDFPLKEARQLVAGLMAPNPIIYWIDLIANAILGWGGFYLVVVTENFTPLNIAAFIVSAFSLYRVAIFIHELVHVKKGTFKLFTIVWNLIGGFPLLIPLFTYQGVHNDHHRRDTYGKIEDGEYLPFGTGPGWKIIGYVFFSFVIPFLFFLRFTVLTPLAWINKTADHYAWERASSLTIDLSYRRPPPTRHDGEHWRLQEVCTTIYAWAAIALIYFGIMPFKVLVVWYFATMFVFLMNSLRTLGAHAYRNPGDVNMTVPDQFLDSVDVTGGILSPFWAPVGLRYHATHHLFPQMPYHNLGKAHALLTNELSDNSLYLAATRRNLFHALSTLWEDSKLAQTKV